MKNEIGQKRKIRKSTPKKKKKNQTVKKDEKKTKTETKSSILQIEKYNEHWASWDSLEI